MDFIFDFIFIKPCLYVYMSLYFPTIYYTLLKLVMNKNPFLQIQFFVGIFLGAENIWVLITYWVLNCTCIVM